MPVLNFEIVQDEPNLSSRPELAEKLALSMAKTLGAQPGKTWVKLSFIEKNHCGLDAVIEKSEYPIFVEVLTPRWKEQDDMDLLAENLALEISKIVDRPPSAVNILFLPPAVNRMAFGGKMLK